MSINVKPVKGAAIYEARAGNSFNPCVWMTVLADEHCDHNCYYVVKSFRTMANAHKYADKMQRKENKSVLKSSLNHTF